MLNGPALRFVISIIVAILAEMVCPSLLPGNTIDIGSRLELMVDDFLIEKMTDLRFVMHKPTKREIAIVHDAPWEANCVYHTVFHDGDLYRMYYEIFHLPVDHGQENRRNNAPLSHYILAAYAESKDGIHWMKPDLGQYEFGGSKHNNILDWEYETVVPTPAVYKDINPNCNPDERYKALSMGTSWTKGIYTLWALKSPDALHWSLLGDRPIITQGMFDSQNLAFWDAIRGEYRAYFRDSPNGLRSVRTATSKDFVNWSESTALKFPGAPPEQLYTSQIIPYYRAPHIFVGFPTRYLDRSWTESHYALPFLDERKKRAEASENAPGEGSPRAGTAMTDGLFMSSRDGVTFKRWGEAFLGPGPQELGHWVYGDQYQNWGIVETKSDIPEAPNELSIYATEGAWKVTGNSLRRYTIRIDGFVSLQAPGSGGEFTTKPLVFSGDKLVINYSTSIAGGVRVEIQTPDGTPIDGFRLEDCPEIFGDSLERTVAWKSGSDLSKLAGQSVRLRMVLKDTDLYSIQFRQQ